MTAQKKYEVTGNLRDHSVAELLLETSLAKLSGSFRLTKYKEKIIIYLDQGQIVYAVSNARRHRLFEFLLREQKIYKAQLAVIDNFVNDIELGKALLEQMFITSDELDEFYHRQVEGIVRYALTLHEGFWSFNPLIRIKKSIDFKIDCRQMLLNFARSLTPEEVYSFFDLEKETFSLHPSPPTHLNLHSQEGFLLSRFEQYPLNINELQAISGLPDKVTMQILYSLWLGGFIHRESWESAFSDEYKTEVQMARVAVKKVEKEPVKIESVEPVEEERDTDPETEKDLPVKEPAEQEITLEEYLDRVENSTNFYETLGLTSDADAADIKRVYFKYAKKFHPDLFHAQTEEDLHKRVQNAFTEIANAYDTLKDKDARQVYDFKMRKELAKTQSGRQTGSVQSETDALERAAQSFEKGYQLLLDEDYKEAAPLLARAVHLDKTNAKYRAYYGKVLSFDTKQSHKAEAELREAVRLDENNLTYRLILSEFYIQINLLKRAEGELTRLLKRFPDSLEARALLDSLQEK